MTLITRLSTAFTDTTLPILQKDPVIPNAGGIVLFDYKNPGTWLSQGSQVTSYNSLVNNSWPTLSASNGNNTYDATTGRVTATSSTSLPLEDSSNRLFADTTANYCISLWVYMPTSNPDRATYFSKGIGSQNVNTHSFVVRVFQTDTESIQMFRPASTDGSATINLITFGSAAVDDENLPTNAVHRVGYAWSKNAGQWQHKGILNNGTPTSYVNSTFGTGTDGVQENAAWTGSLFGAAGGEAPTGLGVYRFYLENLTVSGRTPEQVWDADWARGNGRFS
jgi:hypothetical protein